jgi:hypothetical protein
MRRLFYGVAAMLVAILPFVASIASARQPLSDQQMDAVVAGFALPATTHPLMLVPGTFIPTQTGPTAAPQSLPASVLPTGQLPSFSFPSIGIPLAFP